MAVTLSLPILGLSLANINDPSVLSIADISQYSTVPNANTVNMQITAPGAPTTAVTFTPGAVNVYRCGDLGIVCGLTDCCPLPDGVYSVIYSVPVTVGSTVRETISRNFLRVDDIRCKWKKAFLKIDMSCPCEGKEQDQYKDELRRIELLINGAVATANNCDIKGAFALYKKADNMLDLLSCKFGLPCGSAFKCDPCKSCN